MPKCERQNCGIFQKAARPGLSQVALGMFFFSLQLQLLMQSYLPGVSE